MWDMHYLPAGKPSKTSISKFWNAPDNLNLYSSHAIYTEHKRPEVVLANERERGADLCGSISADRT